MIGLGELHICHRGLGKTRHVATWSVVSVCLWRKCRRHEGAGGLMCWRLEVRGSNQSNKQHWMKPWSDWWGDWKKKKSGRWRGGRGREGGRCSSVSSSSTTPFNTKFSSCLHSSLSLPPFRLAHKSLHPLNSFNSSDDYMTCYSLVGVQTGEEKKKNLQGAALVGCCFRFRWDTYINPGEATD